MIIIRDTQRNRVDDIVGYGTTLTKAIRNSPIPGRKYSYIRQKLSPMPKGGIKSITYKEYIIIVIKP